MVIGGNTLKQRMKACIGAAVLAIGFAAAGSFSGSVAGATPAPREISPANAGATFSPNQAAMMSLTAWIISQPGIYDAGYVESSDNLETRTKTLLWQGTSPLQQDAIAEGARRGITVEIRTVPYSKPQLDEAARTLIASNASDPSAWNGFVLTGVLGPDDDNVGLTLQGHYATTPMASRSTSVAGSAQVDAIMETARGITPAVSAVSITPPPTVLTTRSTDTLPFNAGGMMRGSNGGACTSGFALWHNGVAHTTTARHCTAPSYSAWNSSGSHYGSSVAVSNQAAGRVLSGAGFYWTFDGTWNNSTGSHKSVAGFADLGLHDQVCTSGAMSGAHCDVYVTHMDAWENDGFGDYDSIQAEASVGIAGATGDSGGPVFVPYSGGTYVGAAGMIQYGQYSVMACSTRVASARCFALVGFTSMRTMVNDLGSGWSLRTY